MASPVVPSCRRRAQLSSRLQSPLKRSSATVKNQTLSTCIERPVAGHAQPLAAVRASAHAPSHEPWCPRDQIDDFLSPVGKPGAERLRTSCADPSRTARYRSHRAPTKSSMLMARSTSRRTSSLPRCPIVHAPLAPWSAASWAEHEMQGEAHRRGDGQAPNQDLTALAATRAGCGPGTPGAYRPPARTHDSRHAPRRGCCGRGCCTRCTDRARDGRARWAPTPSTCPPHELGLRSGSDATRSHS